MNFDDNDYNSNKQERTLDNNRFRSRDAIRYYQKNSRKRKSGRGFVTIFIVLVSLIILIFSVFGLVRLMADKIVEKEEEGFSAEQMKHDIYIDWSLIGIEEPMSIRGLTRQEVYDKVLSSYKWDLTIKNSNPELDLFVMPELDKDTTPNYDEIVNDKTVDNKGTSQHVEIIDAYKDITIRPTKSVYKFPDFVEPQLKQLIDQIYDNYLHDKRTSFKKKNIDINSKDFEADFTFAINENDPQLDNQLTQLARIWNTKAVKGQIDKFDKQKNEFTFGDDHKGYEIDVDALRLKIMQEIKLGHLDANINTILKIIDPVGESIKTKYRYVSNYETSTTDNEVRNKNIDLACKAINGKIVKPNEEFSFNTIVGERTEEKGYGYATAYNNGEVVEELGGGVCQVSSTLYNATFEAGLTTTYRRSHTFEPNYITPGLDATVSYPGVDYRFINDSDYSIGIRANYEKGKVKIEIFAVPILERGEVQYLQSKKIEEFDEPPISIIESGEASRGTKGSEWQVFKVIEKPGEAQQKIPNHYARYQGHTPTAYESNTYKDKEGVLRTRAFRTGGSSKSGSSNQNGNRSTNRTTAPTTTQAVPLPAEDGSDVIVPFNINTPM